MKENWHEKKLERKKSKPKGGGLKSPVSKGSRRSKQKKAFKIMMSDPNQYYEDYQDELWE